MFLSCWTPPSTDSNKPSFPHWSQSLPARRLIVDHMPSCVCFDPLQPGSCSLSSSSLHLSANPTLACAHCGQSMKLPMSARCVIFMKWQSSQSIYFDKVFFFWWLCNQLNCDGSVYQFPVTILTFCINLSFSKTSLDTLPKVFPFRFLRVYVGDENS